MANTPKQVVKGAVKFKSIKAAAAAAGIPYMTFYMRMRNGMNASQASHRKVRQYTKRETGKFNIVPVDIYQPA